MSIANTDQAEHWNSGEDVAHWITNQARYDRMNEPFAALILAAAALRPGSHVLDVGCGCGGTTLAAAAAHRARPGGRPRPLRLRCWPGPGPAPKRPACAMRCSSRAMRRCTPSNRPGSTPSYPASATMFFADPVAAFANIRSATRPGGRLAFVCWQPLAANQWLLVPGAALAEHVPPPAGFGSGDGPGMFAFADPDRVREILTAAGWRDIEITSEHASILVGGGGSVEDAVEFLRTGSMGRMMLAGADAGTVERAVASVRAALVPYADAEGVHLGAGVWLVQAMAS